MGKQQKITKDHKMRPNEKQEIEEENRIEIKKTSAKLLPMNGNHYWILRLKPHAISRSF